MRSRDLVVIGGGAAGMLAAASAASNGISVLLLEKMDRTGRKVRITGKGRCNITNTKPWQEFSVHIHPNPNFLKPSFFSFSNIDTINFFEKLGLHCVVERGDRLFPASGVASDVVDTLMKHLDSLGVEVICNAKVRNIIHQDDRVKGVIYEKGNTLYTENAETVIVATGGLSYPLTGSTGDGYKFANDLGIKVNKCFPSLTALKPDFDYTLLKWLILKNVSLSLFVNGQLVQEEMGELEFTDNGIEGSIGFKVSRKAVQSLINHNKVYLVLDLKPALDRSLLIDRLTKDFNSEKSISKVLRNYMPGQLIETFISSNPNKLISDGDSIENKINSIASKMKGWQMNIIGYTSYERAVVTAGGVSLNEIIAKKLSSKRYPNLFFAGEVLDLDGDSGGYNLQIAFSTGYAAGREAAYLIKKERGGSLE